MRVWQRLNAPRNKREQRVAKIARDLEREGIIKLLESFDPRIAIGDILPLLIKGENK